MTDVTLPALAESMTEGTLTAWLKQVGDRVEAGEPLVEVDTDKTTVEVTAPTSGVLVEIRVETGTDGVSVGTVLAVIDETAALDRTSGVVERGARQVAVSPAPAASPVAAAPAAREDAGGPSVPPASGATSGATSVDATPLARRMAAIAGVALEEVRSTGRVRRDELLRHLRGGETSPAPAVSGLPGYRDEPLSAAQRVAATRLTEAKQTVPHFYLAAEVDMGPVVESTASSPASEHGTVTVTAVIVRAVAMAVGQVPAINASWHDGAARVYDRVDVAVAVDTPRGLFTPVIRGAEALTLPAISARLRDLSTRARDGALSPEDYRGGTVTISNLGMFGVSSLYAIVNPPQAAILGVGAVRHQPVVRAGAVVAADVATLTLSADHRVLDGATGARFLRRVTELLEAPAPLFA